MRDVTNYVRGACLADHAHRHAKCESMAAFETHHHHHHHHHVRHRISASGWSDQVLFNQVLRHFKMRQVSFHNLPHSHFPVYGSSDVVLMLF